MPSGKYRRLDYDDMKVAEKLIRAHSIVTPNKTGKGFMVRYHDGWSDQRIAKELGQQLDWTDLSTATVERFRRKAVGGTVGGRNLTGIANPILRVAVQARHMVVALEQRQAESEEVHRTTYEVLRKICEKLDMPSPELPANFGESQTMPVLGDIVSGDDENPEPAEPQRVVEPLRVKRS